MTDLAALHEQELDLLDALDRALAIDPSAAPHLQDRLDAVYAAIREAEWHRARAEHLAQRRAERKLRHAA